MRDKIGFDLWANDYDSFVGRSYESGRYPFAGYREVLGKIYSRVTESGAKNVLDLGFGTGRLSTALYENGVNIYGQDFSKNMLDLAKEKMPKAHLFCGDFGEWLADEIVAQKFDAIIATYSLHHLEDEKKIEFLSELLRLLKKDGRIYIGDIAFESRAELEQCAENFSEDWDTDEFYFVFDELKPHFKNISYEKISICAGVIEIWK